MVTASAEREAGYWMQDIGILELPIAN